MVIREDIPRLMEEDCFIPKVITGITQDAIGTDITVWLSAEMSASLYRKSDLVWVPIAQNLLDLLRGHYTWVLDENSSKFDCDEKVLFKPYIPNFRRWDNPDTEETGGRIHSNDLVKTFEDDQNLDIVVLKGYIWAIYGREWDDREWIDAEHEEFDPNQVRVEGENE